MTLTKVTLQSFMKCWYKSKNISLCLSIKYAVEKIVICPNLNIGQPALIKFCLHKTNSNEYIIIYITIIINNKKVTMK